MDLKWQRSTTKFVIRLPQGNKQLISFPKKSFWTNVSSWLSLKAHQSQQVTANSFWTATSNLPPTTSTGRGTDHGNQISLGPSCKLPSEKIQDALLAMRWRHTEGLRSTPKLRHFTEVKNLRRKICTVILATARSTVSRHTPFRRDSHCIALTAPVKSRDFQARAEVQLLLHNYFLLTTLF